MRNGRAKRIMLGVLRTTANVQLAIDVGSDPITGSVSQEAHSWQPFNGWIELVAAIEAVRISANRGNGSGEPARKTLGSAPGASPVGL